MILHTSTSADRSRRADCADQRATGRMRAPLTCLAGQHSFPVLFAGPARNPHRRTFRLYGANSLPARLILTHCLFPLDWCPQRNVAVSENMNLGRSHLANPSQKAVGI